MQQDPLFCLDTVLVVLTAEGEPAIRDSVTEYFTAPDTEVARRRAFDLLLDLVLDYERNRPAMQARTGKELGRVRVVRADLYVTEEGEPLGRRLVGALVPPDPQDPAGGG